MNLTEIWTGSPEQQRLIKEKSRLDNKKKSGRNLTPKEVELWNLGHATGRRLTLKRLGIGGTAAIAATTAGVGFFKALSVENYETTIRNEILRQGLKPDFSEMLLLDELGFGPIRQYNLALDSERNSLTDLINAGLELIKRSKNPVFDKSRVVLESISSKNEQRLFISSVGTPGTLIDFDFQPLDSGEVIFNLTANASEIAKGENLMGVACSLAHELKHIKNVGSFYKSLDKNLSVPARRSIFERELRTPEAILKEEARGYATQVEAFFHEVALGYPAHYMPSYLEPTAILIKENFNSASVNWIKYIQKQLQAKRTY